MITFPSCEASSPAPAPMTARATLKPVSLRVTSSVASITIAPMLTATSPSRATVRGERRPAIRGPSSAKTSIAKDSGSRRLPVSNASKPSTTCRYTGMTKNVPMRTSCCPTSVESPARSCEMRSSVVSSSWSRPRRARRCSHEANAHSKARPASTMNGTGEKPNGVISVPPISGGVRGCTKPHTLLRRIANTARPRPAAESATPTMSSRGRRSASGARAICPRSSRMPITTTVSPANT